MFSIGLGYKLARIRVMKEGRKKPTRKRPFLQIQSSKVLVNARSFGIN